MKFSEFIKFLEDPSTNITEITVKRSDGKEIKISRKELLGYSDLFDKLGK